MDGVNGITPAQTPLGGEVISIIDGKGRGADQNGGFGNQVKIRTASGEEVWLSHLESIESGLQVGDTILPGESVGKIGFTGNTYSPGGGDGSHLDVTVTKPGGKANGYYTAQQVDRMYVGSSRLQQAIESFNTSSNEIEPLEKHQIVASNQIIDDFRSEPTVKAFESAMTQNANLLVSLNAANPTGDIGAVFTFMKTLDPSSVVRESEFALAASATGLTDKAANYLKRLESGEKLTPNQRDDFRKLAIAYIEEMSRTYELKYSDMQRRAQFSDVPLEVLPSNVTQLIKSHSDSVNNPDPLDV